MCQASQNYCLLLFLSENQSVDRPVCFPSWSIRPFVRIFKSKSPLAIIFSQVSLIKLETRTQMKFPKCVLWMPSHGLTDQLVRLRLSDHFWLFKSKAADMIPSLRRTRLMCSKSDIWLPFLHSLLRYPTRQYLLLCTEFLTYRSVF